MPTCPYCQEPTEKQHLFCRSCGANLRVPEFDRAFCPHCGGRVSLRQEFCHECCYHLGKGNLEREGPVSSERPPPSFVPWLSRGWRWYSGGAIIALAVLLGAMALLVLAPAALKKMNPGGITAATPPQLSQNFASSPNPSQLLTGGASPSGPQASPGKEALLAQLGELLNQIKVAQVKKDIGLFMGSFAEDSPNLEEKKQKTIKIWGNYDFLSLEFHMADLRRIDLNAATVRVTWRIEAKDKITNDHKKLTKIYEVTFNKKGDKWRVMNVKGISDC